MSDFYGATVLIGGGAGALDKIDGADLSDLDGAVVISTDAFYPYHLDADSAAAENSPQVVSPDANAGDKRWLLRNGVFAGLTVYGNAGFGIEVAALPVNVVVNARGGPAASGTSQTGGFRIGSPDNNIVLDFGIATVNRPWIQATDKADLSLEYDLLLNPYGGNLGVRTFVPAAAFHSAVGAAVFGDLTNFADDSGGSGRVFSLGNACGFEFIDRAVTDWNAISQAGELWVWFASSLTAKLYTGYTGNVVEVSAAGDFTILGSYKVDGVQVVSNRVIDARIDDAINSGDATTDGVIDALRDMAITHGLIAAA